MKNPIILHMKRVITAIMMNERFRFLKHICIFAVSLMMLSALIFFRGEAAEEQAGYAHPEYASLLFEDSLVHEINIELEDWEGFCEAAPEENYYSCTVTVDGENWKNVGIRAKGNNSKKLIEKYGWDRYSLKLKFDHYVKGQNYHGLDKFSLDTSFQDNSYMKNYLTYKMMAHMDVPSPLCSYVWVTVNGEDWGLFLAIEEPAEAFIRRSYGKDHGQLYKPDYKSLKEENADVALRYVDDDPASYENIFRKARFDITREDQMEVIQALRILSTGENLEEAVEIDEVLNYFAVQVFVVNLDSYLGPTGHNYFLYIEDGKMQMLPWDYNLAYATYSLGMPNPINDAQLYVNFPIDTPAEGEVMLNRPLFHNLMLQKPYYEKYHQAFDRFLSTWFENRAFERMIRETEDLIGPYVEKDPTAFCSYEDHLVGVETIKTFCLLRAESIRGQLEGTIPSTIRGQSMDKSAFVDASSVWIPDLGEIADLK